MARKTPFQIDTIGWIIASFMTLYFSEVVTAIQVDSRITGTAFQVAVISSLAVVLIFSYLIIWINFYKGIDSEDWEKESPFTIPVATGLSIISGIFWNIALWPVYGMWTPVLTFVLFMGFVMTISIMPPWSDVTLKEKEAVQKVD